MRAIRVFVASAAAAALAASAASAGGGQRAFEVREYEVPAGSHPHDVAPARGGGVWYTEQAAGALGRLDPEDWAVAECRSARVRSSRRDRRARRRALDHRRGPERDPTRRPADEARPPFPLPSGREAADLNTATFDQSGVLWFTGQSGVYGRLDPKVGRVRVFDAPGGSGPVRDHDRRGRGLLRLARRQLPRRIDLDTGKATVLRAADARPGCAPRLVGLARSDLGQRVERRQARQVRAGNWRWREWRLPGATPQPYAVYVDERDASGSATSARTLSCASTRAPSSSRQSRSRARQRRCASSSAARARCGERSRALTGSSPSARASSKGLRPRPRRQASARQRLLRGEGQAIRPSATRPSLRVRVPLVVTVTSLSSPRRPAHLGSAALSPNLQSPLWSGSGLYTASPIRMVPASRVTS